MLQPEGQRFDLQLLNRLKCLWLDTESHIGYRYANQKVIGEKSAAYIESKYMKKDEWMDVAVAAYLSNGRTGRPCYKHASILTVKQIFIKNKSIEP